MSYFIFDQSKNVDVFANTRLIERIGEQRRVCGVSYQETKNLHPSTMALIFQCDIQRAISEDKLPQMLFKVTATRQSPTPIYRVEIQHLAEPIVLRTAEDAEPEINCEPSSIGRIQLSDLAHYVRRKVMQILWKYNADLITTKGIYGHQHFNYQIALSSDLIERQIKSFDIERQRILNKESEESVVGKAA
jgi:hypothetical protein